MLMAGGQLALLGGLVSRMYYLQVVERDKYQALSDKNRINLRVLPPRRGLVLDRYGTPIADNTPTYRVEITAEQAADVDDVLQHLTELTPLTEGQAARVATKLKHQRPFIPVVVVEELSMEDISKVELNLPDLLGVSVQMDEKRDYPYGGIASHILGYVASPSEEDVANNPSLATPGLRNGKAGLEKQYEELLLGEAGTAQEEVNASGRVMRQLGRQEAKSGSNLTTTLDVRLQSFAHQRLVSQLSGAAVVLDVESGAILAMASAPGYDPSAFYHGISADYWRRLTSDEFQPLTNKAISGQYAPGSTFKPITALAILKAGIDPAAEVMCSGVYTLGNAKFHCWKKGGHGRVSMVSAIQHSCDVYFYEMARRIGIDAVAEMAKRFGLGQITGVDLPSERSGLIPSTGWKRAALGAPWQQGETLVSAIGQGYVLATPLQLATMAAQLANGGRRITPYFVLPQEGQQANGEIGIDPRWLEIVTGGMNLVTNDRQGTAFAARIDIPGMEMAGKSGTSQVRRISLAERRAGVIKNEDLPWSRRDHALFIAFAPVAAPKYACAVVVEHGGGGSAVAAPIARDILVDCQTKK
ncbi:MAG TPA: penicillin-binding protein 2 [Terriglobia bacterium]|nr:penicillin-binding protein 2 [Terriglobia bacterium]